VAVFCLGGWAAATGRAGGAEGTPAGVKRVSLGWRRFRPLIPREEGQLAAWARGPRAAKQALDVREIRFFSRAAFWGPPITLSTHRRFQPTQVAGEHGGVGRLL